MDFRVYVLLLTTGANLLLGLFILYRDWRSKVNLFYSLMLFSIAAWSFFLAMNYFAENIQLARVAGVLINLAATAVLFFFYYFSIYFPYEVKRATRKSYFVSIVIFCLMIYIVIFIRMENIAAFDHVNHNHTNIINPLGYYFFAAYFISMMFFTYLHFFTKLKYATSIHRKQIRIILYSTLVAAIFGSVFNLLLLKVSYEYIWLGPVFTISMVFIVARLIFFEKQ